MVQTVLFEEGTARSHGHRRAGQSIIEAIVGLMVFVIIALAMLDVGALVMATTINNDMAARAARVAASQNTFANAKAAVQKLNFPTSPIITSVNQTLTQGQTNSGNAKQATSTNTVTSVVEVRLPVPVPFVPGTSKQLTTTATAPALLF